MRTPALQRWWRSIEVSPTGCWLWTRQTTKRGGYPLFDADDKTVRAHRWGYEQLVGPLVADQHLDHICHNASICRPPAQCPHRRCVNPLHLEPVTLAENNQRAKRDTCRRGHPWTPESTIPRTASGGRECRICSRERHAEARRRRQDAAQ